MEVDRMPVADVEKASGERRPGALLGGIWLALARMVWLAWAIVTSTLIILGVPAVYRQLTTPYALMPGLSPDDIQGELWQLSVADIEALHTMGFSIEGYAIYRIIAHVSIFLTCILVAAVIFWRKSSNTIALLASLTLLTMGSGLSWVFLLGAIESQPWLLLLVQILTSSTFPLLILFLYFFPDGRIVPPWMRIPAIIGAVGLMAWDLTFQVWGGPLDGLVLLILMTSAGVAQIWRYRRISNEIQRQQTKWVVFGATVSILGFIVLGNLYPALLPVTSRPRSFLYFFVEPIMHYLFLLFIPLSIAFSILRYRLYDIDLIIRRTLVYGMLTATLALIYWSGVVGLQALLRPITGPGNDFAIVASTLLIAALFLPLRRRIQSFIDRRFYRRKYNAAKTLTAFSRTARDEVELDRLTGRLVEVVEETMQPAHVSLWLSRPERKA